MEINVKEKTEVNSKYTDSNIQLNNCSNILVSGVQMKSESVIAITGSNSFELSGIKNASKKVFINANNCLRFSISNIKEVTPQ